MRYLDPTAAGLGVFVTVASWALGIAPLRAAVIGVVAFAIADTGAVLRARRRPIEAAPVSEDTSPVRLHEQEERWISRGGEAVASIRRTVRSLASGPLRDPLADVADEAEEVLDGLRTLAVQVTAVREAAQALDASRLSIDLTRLTTELEQRADAGREEDVRRSVDAVREQLTITRRLDAARKALQARIESGTFGLQRLAAQVGEMSVLATSDVLAQQGERIDELTAGLDALRAGLGDAGALSRRALGALDDEGDHDAPIVP